MQSRVNAQRFKSGRGWLEGVHLRACKPLLDEEREQSDVSSDIYRAVAVIETYPTFEVCLVGENLFVQIIGFILVEVRDLHLIRKPAQSVTGRLPLFVACERVVTCSHLIGLRAIASDPIFQTNQDYIHAACI